MYSYMMARKRKGGRRRMGRYLKGNVDEEVALTVLSSKDVVSSIFDEVVFDRTFVSSIVASYALANWTPIANAGPIIFGVAHSDYNDAEIEEWLELTGQWNEGNLVSSREVGKRLIRQVGSFGSPDAATDVQRFNDGRPMKTKLNWILLEGQTLRLWAYNAGSAAVATTAPSLTANGHANLFPR